MGLVATKPVFGVSDKVRFKPACSQLQRLARKIEILLVASLDMILSKKQITKALFRLRGCAGWSAPVLFANPQRQVFLRRGPICSHIVAHVYGFFSLIYRFADYVNFGTYVRTFLS